MRKPCPCCGGVPGGFGGTLVVNSQPADLQAEVERLRGLLAQCRGDVEWCIAYGHANGADAQELAEAEQRLAAIDRAAHRNAAQQEGQGDGE